MSRPRGGPPTPGSWTKENHPRSPGRPRKPPELKQLDAAKLAADKAALKELAKAAVTNPSIRAILREVVAEERAGVKTKISEGLTRAEPKHALGYVRLAAEYLDGKPVDPSPPSAPVLVILSHDRRWDPLAGPPPNEEGVFSEARPALPAKRGEP